MRSTKSKLAPAQEKVLKLVCADYTNMQIAKKLKCSERTIERIKESLHKVTKSRSNLGLFKWALKKKLYTFKF